MMPSDEQIEALHRKYAPNDFLFELIFGHCQIVAEIAVWCAQNVSDQAVNTDLLRKAALLHDIATYVYFSDAGQPLNGRLYKLHAIFGAKLVVDEGIDSRIAQLIETHSLMGISEAEIREHQLPLPYRDYQPTAIEGDILAYADCFHSKDPIFNDPTTYYQKLQTMPQQAEKFKAAMVQFGVPDLDALATKYNQKIK